MRALRRDAAHQEGWSWLTHKPSNCINLVTPPRIMKTATAKFTIRLHSQLVAMYANGSIDALRRAHAQYVGEVHGGGLFGEMWEPQLGRRGRRGRRRRSRMEQEETLMSGRVASGCEELPAKLSSLAPSPRHREHELLIGSKHLHLGITPNAMLQAAAF